MRALAVLASAGALLVACGGDGDRSRPASDYGPRTDSEVRLVDCADWKAADVGERISIVAQVRDFAGGPTGSPAGRGRTLPDEQAYELLEGWCSRKFAHAFKLYKLYVRAAAFQSLATPSAAGSG